MHQILECYSIKAEQMWMRCYFQSFEYFHRIEGELGISGSLFPRLTRLWVKPRNKTAVSLLSSEGAFKEQKSLHPSMGLSSHIFKNGILSQSSFSRPRKELLGGLGNSDTCFWVCMCTRVTGFSILYDCYYPHMTLSIRGTSWCYMFKHTHLNVLSKVKRLKRQQ